MPPLSSPQEAVLNAALAHVPFDGWSDKTLQAALADCNMDAALGPVLFPRGGLDLALAFHHQGDRALQAALTHLPPHMTRIRDKIAYAVMARLDILHDPEIARRGCAFFALPHNMAHGAGALWHTADTIWNGLGDNSQDYNRYSKRMTLSAVYSACLLFWLNDHSPDHADTRAFIARRIDDVMQIEKNKARCRQKPVFNHMFNLLSQATSGLRPPPPPEDLPGYKRG